MLYDNSTSRQEELRQINLIRSYLANIDGSYTWSQIKKDLQEHILPRSRNFSTWSSREKRVDQVLNRKVPQEQLSSLVLSPQKSEESRRSPK